MEHLPREGTGVPCPGPCLTLASTGRSGVTSLRANWCFEEGAFLSSVSCSSKCLQGQDRELAGTPRTESAASDDWERRGLWG